MNTKESVITPEQIKTIASQLKKTRAAYEPLIDFHSEMFIAQEESKKYLDLEPLILEPKNVKLKIDSGNSLTDTSAFIVDLNQAEELLVKICDIAQKRAVELRGSAEKIVESLSNKSLNVRELFNSLLQNDRETFKNIAQNLNLNEDVLVFFICQSMLPSVETCAAQLAHYLQSESDAASLDEQFVWNRGYCPICGNYPQMAFLNQSGEKHLICSFCMHNWKASRMGCSLCQNKEKDKQHYFFNEEEKEYRVDLCDNCGQYIKVVDVRELSRAFYAPLEMLCTIHLDMQAMGHGYTSVVPNEISESK